MKTYQDRSYRNLLHKDNLISFSVVVKETDLFVHALKPLKDITKELMTEFVKNLQLTKYQLETLF